MVLLLFKAAPASTAVMLITFETKLADYRIEIHAPLKSNGFYSVVIKENPDMSILILILVGAAIIGVLGMAIKVGLKVLTLAIILAAIVFVFSYLSRTIGHM